MLKKKPCYTKETSVLVLDFLNKQMDLALKTQFYTETELRIQALKFN